MEFILMEEELNNLLKDKKGSSGVTHDTGKIKATERVLPFTSSKKTNVMEKQFPQVLGEFTRNLSGISLKINKVDDNGIIEEKPIIRNIVDEVEYEDDDVRFDFEQFIETFLYDSQNELNPVHPFIYNYYQLSADHKQSVEEKKVAHFIRDILVGEDESIAEIFKDKNGEDILTSLILKKLETLVEKQETKQKFFALLPQIQKLFKSDFKFVSQHKDYFLQHYPMMIKYYYFLYLSQLTLKLDQFEKADYTEVTPVYYALDWESINKRRKAASDMEGYKRIKEKASHLFVHVHTICHLSYNTYNIADFNFIPYGEFVKSFSEKDDQQKAQFTSSLNSWINTYKQRAALNRSSENINEVSEGFRELFECLKEGMSTSVCEKYGKSVQDAATPFLKFRGSLGYTLNLTKEFLLFLTAVSVKNDRIPLKELFIRLENRGIALDRYSKKAVNELFDSLNLIDKKSDSGDAQYVKPIL